MTDERHELRLYDVTDDGDLAVDYQRIKRYHAAVAADHTHARLPFECVGLFGDDGRVEVGELSVEERAWIEAESENIDLSGVPA
jgi:hypothetical protein